MPNEQIYQDELNEFTKRYNMPSFNLKKVAGAAHTLRYADSFLNGSAPATDPASQYIKWISSTVSIYFETNTRLNPTGKYLSSFDYHNFLEDFERLAQAKYDSELIDWDRKPYAGALPFKNESA